MQTAPTLIPERGGDCIFETTHNGKSYSITLVDKYNSLLREDLHWYIGTLVTMYPDEYPPLHKWSIYNYDFWLFGKSSVLQAVMITFINNFSFHIYGFLGKLDSIKDIDVYAKLFLDNTNYKVITFAGRPGWQRVLKKYNLIVNHNYIFKR